MSTLTRRTFNGIKWTATSTITNLILQLGYTAVMARLLDPVAFGLVAMANVVLRFGGYFANMGMSQALIQKETLTQRDIQSAFTSSILLGGLFTVVIYFLAPAIAIVVFKDTEVIPIVRVLSLTFLLSGLSSTSGSLLRRKLNFKPLSIVQIVSFGIYAALGIFLALQGYGVWSLVYASLFQSFFSSAVVYLMVRHSLKPYFKWSVYKPLFAFGGKISIISFLEFISISLDTMFIGRYLGSALLGIYNRANMIIQMPLYKLNTSVSGVLFPAFSSLQKERQKLKRVYLSSSSVVAFVFLSLSAGAAVASESIVLVLLGDEWREAVPVLRIVAMIVPFKMLSHYGGIICDATATLNVKLGLEVMYIAALAGVLFLIRNESLNDYALAILCMEGLKFTVYMFITKNILGIRMPEYFKAYLPAILSATIISAAIFITNRMMESLNLSYALQLTLNMATGSTVLIIVLFLNFNKPVWNELNDKIFSQVRFFDKTMNGLYSKIHK